MSKHTPGPWIGSYEPMGTPEIIARDGESIGVCWPGQVSMERAEANRDFIVLACNTHYELLEACKETVRILEDKEFPAPIAFTLIAYIKQMKDAIAKAEGRV